jgi:hypothetical protein
MVEKKRLDALMSSIFDLNEARKHITFKGLIYGDPGAGKTVLASSIGERVLFVVADPDGWQSLLNHPKLGLGTRITPMQYHGLSQLEALADAFTEGGTDFDQYDTVVLDTLSNIADLDKGVVIKEKQKKKGDSFDFEDQQWPIYNQTSLRVKDALLKLFLAPVNVVATAHAREVELKGGTVTTAGVKQLRPKFSPEIFAAINGYCSLIGYMTANEAGVDSDGSIKYKRLIQYHPTRSIVAKTRIGGLPATEANPNLRAIVEAWQEKGGQMLSHEEAEAEMEENEGLNPELPASEESQDNVEFTDFGVN